MYLSNPCSEALSGPIQLMFLKPSFHQATPSSRACSTPMSTESSLAFCYSWPRVTQSHPEFPELQGWLPVNYLHLLGWVPLWQLPVLSSQLAWYLQLICFLDQIGVEISLISSLVNREAKKTSSLLTTSCYERIFKNVTIITRSADSLADFLLLQEFKWSHYWLWISFLRCY